MGIDVDALGNFWVLVESGHAVEGNKFWKKFVETFSPSRKATAELGERSGDRKEMLISRVI
jgi:hypothetical protein